ncbi:ABC transporter ATP-binding protein [Rhizobiaceae sp. 2RAB30]
MSSVRCDRVRKQFGPVPIIHDLSAEFVEGEFTALVGPSGCGKSTLLRLIAGLETATSGDISIGGRIVNRLEPRDRGVAMVFQSYALYPHMTVADNMSFALRLAGMGKEAIGERVEAASSMLGLGQLLGRLPRQLSGGQRQRVAMGRAIVRQPKVFLFDEPLSNLDAKLRVKMRSEIRALHQRLASTTIYVTHDQVEAMTMADRIVVLRDGLVEQVGAPLDLYRWPDNLFVAGFIGSPAMNLIEGMVTETGFAAAGGATLPLPPNAVPAAGRRLVYGIRPEHIAPSPDGIALPVTQMEPTGAETLIGLRCGDQEILCAMRGYPPETEEGRLRVAVDTTQAHLFDADTGKRVRPLQ